MRFCTSGPRRMLFIVTHLMIVYSRILIYCVAEYAEYAEYLELAGLHQRLPSAKVYETTNDLERIAAKPTSNWERRRREIGNADFTWKVTKTPKFITAKTEKHVEPILRVYPSDVAHRSGRSRELVASQRNVGVGVGTGAGARRVIYYATLPEVIRYSTNALPNGERYTANYPTANQQRSFAAPKGGKEFVTRVQSSIIDVRPRGENKKEIGSTPTFTIVDANPTPYSGYAPYHRIHHADYNLMANVDKPNYNNYVPSSYYHNPKSQYELLPPQNLLQPYHANHFQYQQQQQQQQPQQAGPYFQNEVGKVTSLHYSPPYPSRHTRFPADRYPVTSPLGLGLGHFDVGFPPPPPPTASLPLGDSHLNLHNANYHSYQPNLALDAPSSNFNPSSHSSNNLDLGSNFGSPLDHGLDLDDHHSVSPLKDKFLDYNSLSQKYLDLNSFGQDFPFKHDYKDPFKFDKEPFKGPFSQVSDWLTSKPFDLSSLDFDDATSNRDYQIKGSAHSVVVDSLAQMHNQNITNFSSQMDSNNTLITPFTSSNSTDTG